MHDRECLERVLGLLQVGQLSTAMRMIRAHLSEPTESAPQAALTALAATVPEGDGLASLCGPQCQKKRMSLGLAYPRTCRICGLGPCAEPGDA